MLGNITSKLYFQPTITLAACDVRSLKNTLKYGLPSSVITSGVTVNPDSINCPVAVVPLIISTGVNSVTLAQGI